jgi:formylglycine-generating enzyme required for sulfatase activity
MATYGIYQVLDPLYVTPTGSVCSARIVGGEDAGRVAAKVFNPPKPDPDEPNWEPKYFLDRAQVQRRVAAAGGAHWAPVYASGFTPEGGAYYITDYHALTAHKLIEGRVALDARALHAVVSSVLAGLGEIRRIADRAHANLKPTNVLLVGKGPLDELRAVLTDPGQEYKAEKDGEAGDLHALGQLIHQLVLHRPSNGPNDLATAGAPEWSRLGDKGEAWRELCADLLTFPLPSRAATLAGVSKTLGGLAPAKVKVPQFRLPGSGQRPAKAAKPARAPARQGKPARPGRLRRRAVQVAAVLLLVGSGLGIVAAMEAATREELCDARAKWFGPLAAGLAEPQRRQRFEADAHLRRVADGVQQVERAGVECNGGRVRPLGFLGYARTRAALVALRQVERDLAPETWPRLQRLQELAKAFGQRGWQQPAGYVSQLVEGVRPVPAAVRSGALSRPSAPSSAAPAAERRPSGGGGGGDETPAPAAGSLVARIDRVLRLQPVIEEQAPRAEEAWRELDAVAGELERSDDTLVRGFGAMLRRDGITAVRLGDDGFEGLDKLGINKELAGQVLAALRDTPSAQVDNLRFANDVLRTIDPADLEVTDVDVWLRMRPTYVVERQKILEQHDAMQKQYLEMQAKVANSGVDPAEIAAFELEYKNVEEALRDFKQIRFIEQDIASGVFTKRVAEIDGQIRNLDRYYHAEDAADWLKNLAPVYTRSERIKSFWGSWVRTLERDAKLMAEQRDLFAENKDRTVRLRDVLTELDLLPQPPEDLNEAFAAAAMQHRESRLGAILERMNAADPQLEPDELQAEREAMTRWFDDLRALAGDFPIGNRLLTIEDRPDEAWQAKNPTFWNDRLVRGLVHGDLDRIQRLQKLRKASRTELAREATTDAVRPEVRLAAWQLLGSVTPAWPASTDELATEATLRAKVLEDLKPLKEFDRETLTEEVQKEGPRRWRRFVEAITPAEAAEPDDTKNPLEIALNRLDEFNMNSTALQEISPPARFNVWLYLAYAAPRRPKFTDKDVDVILGELRLAAKGLGDEDRAAAVLAKLETMDEPEPFGGQQIGDVFTLPVQGLAQPLEFKRVEPRTGRPFYLGTREVTLGQFAGALDAARLWEEARRLQWPHRPDERDGRRGPRVWEWADPREPRLGPAPLWLTPDDQNDFPPELRDRRFNRNVIAAKFGGMPSDLHPMQYVSANAALYYAAALGCRLPTSAEWREALAASGRTVNSEGWNLRDQASWDAFRAYAAKQGISPDRWPDREAFPEGSNGRRAAAAAAPVAARPGNDATLLFRPAPSSSGTLHDLIGNLAEYVCDAPDAFERWPEKRTAESIKDFLANTPDAVAVIGGSALSPADVAVDQPRGVKDTHRGYSDVGLRLAFTAPARNKAERLKWALAGEEFLEPPRTVSADTGGR